MGKRWKTIKDAARDLPDRIHDEEVAKVRLHYYTSWAYICHQDEYASEDELKARKLSISDLGAMIDWDNPHVHIQWLLCDPQYQRAIKKPEGREAFLTMLTDEERDIYLNFVDDNGHRYTELENAKVTKAVGKAVKEQIKRKVKRKEKGKDIVEQV